MRRTLRLWWRANSRNPLVMALWLLLAAAMMGGTTLLLFLSQPGAVDPQLDETVRDEVFRFSGLSLDYVHLSVRFEEGYLVPVHRGDDVAGAVILGRGTYRFQPEGALAGMLRLETGHTTIFDAIHAVYVSLSHREFENLRYTAGARPASVDTVADEARSFLARAGREARGAVPLGAPGPTLFTGASRVIQLDGEAFGHVEVAIGQDVALKFVDLGRSVILPNPEAAAAGADSPLAPASGLRGLMGMFGSITLLLLIMVQVLTADLRVDPSPRRVSMLAGELLLVVVLLAVEISLIFSGERLNLTATTPVALYSVFAVLVLLRPSRSRRPFADVGLHPANGVRGLMVGLLVGILGFIAATLAFPTGVLPLPAGEWGSRLLFSFIGVGLLTEIYRRGFLQTVLQQALGPRAGTLATSLLVGAVFLIPRLMIMEAHLRPALLLQGLLVLPVTEFLFGHLYSRTGNVYGGALARGLMDFLPRVLTF